MSQYWRGGGFIFALEQTGLVKVRPWTSKAAITHSDTKAQISEAAGDLVRVFQIPPYLNCKSETEVNAIFKKQLEVFVKKSHRKYWEKILPAPDHPECASMSTPGGWGVIKGTADLLQCREANTTQEIKYVLEMQKKARSSA